MQPSLTQTERAYSLSAAGYSPAPTGLDLRLTAIRSPDLPFNGRHSRNPCYQMDYYSFTDHGGMEYWVGLVGWPTVDTLLTKWSHVNHRSGTDQV